MARRAEGERRAGGGQGRTGRGGEGGIYAQSTRPFEGLEARLAFLRLILHITEPLLLLDLLRPLLLHAPERDRHPLLCDRRHTVLGHVGAVAVQHEARAAEEADRLGPRELALVDDLDLGPQHHVLGGEHRNGAERAVEIVVVDVGGDAVSFAVHVDDRAVGSFAPGKDPCRNKAVDEVFEERGHHLDRLVGHNRMLHVAVRAAVPENKGEQRRTKGEEGGKREKGEEEQGL